MQMSTENKWMTEDHAITEYRSIFKELSSIN